MAHVFEEHCCVITSDVKFGYPSIAEAFGQIKDKTGRSFDWAFVCVPTPSEPETGKVDMSIVNSVCDELVDYDVNVCIKSTSNPAVIRTIQMVRDRISPNSFAVWPEFLREATPIEDTEHADVHILGGPGSRKLQLLLVNHSIYKSRSVDYLRTDDAVPAALAKYYVNGLLATKVAFNNQFARLADSMCPQGWDMVASLALGSNRERIGASHMMVPGPDGRLGFGGSCFPKDMKALMHFIRQQVPGLNLIKSVVEYNDSVRSLEPNADKP